MSIPTNQTRRQFIAAASTIGAAALFPANFLHAAPASRHILLRSGWQTENIGDIAHTPGVLVLLEKYLPDAQITFWPYYEYLPEQEVSMLMKRFPKLRIVQGKLDPDGKASSPELEAAIASADFMLHNSGPFMVAWSDAEAFHKRTGKPFGVYGVTYGHWVFGTREKETLNKARFVYFRDSVSLVKAKQDGVHAPIMEFSPDAVFALDVQNQQVADAFLKSHGLEHGKFLCCIPKQRFTPTWLHVLKKRPFDGGKHARNEEMKEHDHIPLREAIIAVTRQTQMKVLICHEDETEMGIGKEWLLDKLPDDVKKKVVWLDHLWTLDEAVSVYKRSAGLFGNEMHSPIMCIGNGIPAIVVRWVEQSSKGVMWEDIGLKEWLFNFDCEADVQRLVPTVLAMAKDPGAAKAKAGKAQAFTHHRLRQTMAEVLKASTPV
ncbi:polysaccharide pyruvyl transferase family protein [Dyadobacter sp. CY261]|uniref:polysaccharide pyruvyl transferase family protein n=1 Tax=Dyadobacter sp. CY261 TaxID=2907203 RepID=UPI001F1BA850|nr:polysaccharide pyruvyl transferase family protein [Dyadobacter sp. CY261]MCF0069742.1 polysaccharide pyruvyl transferase family protein [Dyadobacter sp. CY261]